MRSGCFVDGRPSPRLGVVAEEARLPVTFVFGGARVLGQADRAVLNVHYLRPYALVSHTLSILSINLLSSHPVLGVIKQNEPLAAFPLDTPSYHI